MKKAHIDLGKHPILLALMEDVTRSGFPSDVQEIRSRHGVHRVCIE